MIMSLVGRPGNWTAYIGVTQAAALTRHVKEHGDKAWSTKSIADITVPFWCYDGSDGSGAAPVVPLTLVGRAGNFVGYYRLRRVEAILAHAATYGPSDWDTRSIEADAPFWCYDADVMP